jgi:hypothetical protein
MEDINSGLNAVRKAIESEVAASTVKYRRGYYSRCCCFKR